MVVERPPNAGHIAKNERYMAGCAKAQAAWPVVAVAPEISYTFLFVCESFGLTCLIHCCKSPFYQCLLAHSMRSSITGSAPRKVFCAVLSLC